MRKNKMLTQINLSNGRDTPSVMMIAVMTPEGGLIMLFENQNHN